MSLRVEVAGLKLKTPVMNASGVLEWSPEAARKLLDAGAGAVVLKSATKEPRKGYDWPRIVRAFGGYIVAVGIANPGALEVSRMIRGFKEVSGGAPVIASATGFSQGDFIEVAGLLEEGGADAVELNLSCPHFKGGGLELGQDPQTVYSIVRDVAGSLKVPVIAKLGLADRIVDISAKALEAGAKALTLMNTIKAMKIDVYTKKPVLSNRVGGLAGSAIHPVAVRVIYEVYRETKAEIIGAGGVRDWETAVEMILAGARAVQVGAALIDRGEAVIAEIVRGLEKYVWLEGMKNIEELIGLAHRT
ncbi:MAG: dihydroorotate dehydrogenase PyrD [Acidilobaceae archaeon]